MNTETRLAMDALSTLRLTIRERAAICDEVMAGPLASDFTLAKLEVYREVEGLISSLIERSR